MSKLAELWAKEIEVNRKILEDVPAGLREEVRKLLEANVLPEEEIT